MSDGLDGGCISVQKEFRVLGLSPREREQCGRRKFSGIGMWNQNFIFGQIKNEMSIRNQIMT